MLAQILIYQISFPLVLTKTVISTCSVDLYTFEVHGAQLIQDTNVSDAKVLFPA